MSGKQLVYWDTCIFLAWLKNEKRDNPNDMLGVEQLASLFDLDQIDIATSVITITEVLESSIGEAQYKLFRALFSRKNCHLIDVNRDIAEISHEIRNYYRAKNSTTLSTPDCLHLATAIWFHCGVFYTFDGCSDRHDGLLKLPNPLVDKYPLQILIPEPEQVTQLSFNI